MGNGVVRLFRGEFWIDVSWKESMKYVKLIAKPDTWFKEGTEVYDYDCHPPKDIRRVTLEDWESYENFACLVRGIRVVEADYEVKLFGKGERWDGENCGCDEFEVEIVDSIC